MALAQMREFTSAYYGFGTAFEVGTTLLADPKNTIQLLLKIQQENLKSDDGKISNFIYSYRKIDEKAFKKFLASDNLFAKAIKENFGDANVESILENSKKVESANQAILIGKFYSKSRY